MLRVSWYTTSMIKTILFDFYGVFVPDSYSTWLNNNGLKREGEFADIINLLDRDEIEEADFIKRLSELVGRKVTMAEIHGQAIPDQNLVDLVLHLKNSYSVSLLSNASKKLRVKLSDFNLIHLFDEIIISGEVGYAKPSDDIFQLAIARLSVKPSEILYVDDNPLNVAAGNRNGINSILYRTPSDIHTRLSSGGTAEPGHKIS